MSDEDNSKLPFKESRKENLTRRFGNMWNLPKFGRHGRSNIKTRWPWRVADIVLKASVGMNIDTVYSRYLINCKRFKVYEYYDHDLMTYFYDDIYCDNNRMVKRRYGWWEESSFYPYVIDKQNRLQRNKKYKPRKKVHNVFFTDGFYDCPQTEYKVLTFKKRRDPELLRLKAEQRVRLRASKKEEMSDAEFRYWLKYNENKAAELAAQRLEAHGFDPETSFRNH